MAVKNRIWYWDALRIAAMVFLVIRHSATATFEFVPTFGRNWWICNIYGSLSAWMVPVFMMISGSSFLDPNRNVSTKKLYLKNIKHMLTVFFVWSAFYAGYNIVMEQTGGKDFWSMFAEGHFHLWFLPMIIGIYMLVPLLRPAVKNGKYASWIMISTGIIGVVIPSLQDLDLIWDNTLISQFYTFGMISAYVSFFFLGYWLHNHDFSKRERSFIYIMGIVSTVVVFVGTYVLSMRDGCHNEDIQSDNNLFTCLQGIAIFVWCKQYFKGKQLKESTCKFMLDISGLTFGVYMVHVVFLAFLDRMGFSPVTYSAAYMIPMLIGFVLPTSFFVSWCIKKIPFVGKYIV